jgi:hypothetical protein
MRASATFESRTCQIEDQPAASVEQIADKQFECVSFWTDGGGSREVQDHDIRFDFRGRHAKGHDGFVWMRSSGGEQYWLDITPLTEYSEINI